jgi:2-keto-3-deoxy-L-rhamnonate aldolase RhmA
MNDKERSLVRHLQKMHERYGALGVKAEFEAEGSTFDEVMLLKLIASAAGMRVVALKIGGPEDVWGIKQALKLDANYIVAPMVESPYALKKYLEAVKKFVSSQERKNLTVAVNIETGQAVSQIDLILAIGIAAGLQSVTVGRVDLAESVGLGRSGIDSEEIFKLTEEVCRKAKAAGLMATMGGAVELGSRDFITRLSEAGILDRFETRKIIFPAASGLKLFREAILDAHMFELGWLEAKRDFHGAIIKGEEGRIALLQSRIEALRKEAD